MYLEYKKKVELFWANIFARKFWTKVRRVARMTLRFYRGTCDGSVVD